MNKLKFDDEDVPSKPFEVIVEIDGQETIVQVAVNITMLDEDYRRAIKTAKLATRKDGKMRRVKIRQTLMQTFIEKV